MVWRLQLIEHLVAMLTETLVQDKIVETALTVLVAQASTTLVDLVEVAARAAAEILVETGDVRRFTGTGPIPATSGEGGCHPVRLRLNRGGNPASERRPAPHVDDPAPLRTTSSSSARHCPKAGAHRREAMRVLTRHLSDALYRTMLRDTAATPP